MNRECYDIDNGDPEQPWTEECSQCGREFDTTQWHRTLCGPCRRKREEAARMATTVTVSAIMANQIPKKNTAQGTAPHAP